MERGFGCPGVKDASMLTSFGTAQDLSPKDPVDVGVSKAMAVKMWRTRLEQHENTTGMFFKLSLLNTERNHITRHAGEARNVHLEREGGNLRQNTAKVWLACVMLSPAI